jgi:hypothetical protein
MSIKIMNLVWEHYPFGGGELLLALALADHSDDFGRRIYPSLAYSARKTRQSERAVRYQLRRMNESEWLIPSKYEGGGRGRTTEYYINPSWIENPANFAPFCKTKETRQKAAAKPGKSEHKGGNLEHKGGKAIAPQPPQESSITTTTTTEPLEVVVAVDDELIFPSVRHLGRQFHGSVKKLLDACPADQRQQVLDELTAMLESNKVRSNPLGVLRTLCLSASKGVFIPEQGVLIAHRRARDIDQANAHR